MKKTTPVKDADSLQRFGVSMEESLLVQFDRMIAHKGYATRSEALRDMMRASLEEDVLEDEAAESVGTISLVYNHHARNLTAKLTEIQHGALDRIVSNLHIHLDEERCLEVLIVRGPSAEVRELADRLISIKGVKHGKFVTTVDPSIVYHSHSHGHADKRHHLHHHRPGKKAAQKKG